MTDSLKAKLKNYKMPARAQQLIESTPIVFMVGVSAAGKDTVRTKLLLTGKYHHIISHTTRLPRANHGVMELDGKDYHFIDFDRAERMLDNSEFVEAKVFSGNIYGTSVAEIKKAHDGGKIAITDIEVQGVAEYRRLSKRPIPIFLLPPDFETWQQRLKDRYFGGQPDSDDMEKRLHTAKIELKEALDKPYFEYVVNKDLETTVKIVDEIAHGYFSDKKNAEARQVAQDLLARLEAAS